MPHTAPFQANGPALAPCLKLEWLRGGATSYRRCLSGSAALWPLIVYWAIGSVLSASHFLLLQTYRTPADRLKRFHRGLCATPYPSLRAGVLPVKGSANTLQAAPFQPGYLSLGLLMVSCLQFPSLRPQPKVAILGSLGLPPLNGFSFSRLGGMAVRRVGLNRPE